MAVLALLIGADADAGQGGPFQRMPPATVAGAPPGLGDQTAVFGAGCFWGAQEVFSHLRGVKTVVAGYAGGDASTATYRSVSSGTTGHVEAAEVTYDPTRISYEQLLDVYMSIAVDPTEANGQNPDHGPQYSAVIFYDTNRQKAAAKSYVAELNASVLAGRSAVRLQQNHGFYPAEPFHQGYAERHPDDPYIKAVDTPRIEALRSLFPEIYREAATERASAQGG